MADEIQFIERRMSCPCGCGLLRLVRWKDGDPEATVIYFPFCGTWAIAKLTAEDTVRFNDPFYWAGVRYGSEKAYDPPG
jgi:hypothetical protein